MSAPPDSHSADQNSTHKMSGQNHHEQVNSPQQEQPSNVRHIPIFVEGRDEPVINKSVDHGTHFGDSKPTYAPPPQQPHIDREQYFADDGPGNFHHPSNFTRPFGTTFNKGFRQGPQPFSQQKMYPQTAFTRGASPQRSQSPKAQMFPEEHFMKVPVHHEQNATPKPDSQKPQQKHTPNQHNQKQQSPPRQQQPSPRQPSPQPEAPPQPKAQQTSANDPITLIVNIQTDVLNLMTDVENFTGTKKDKKYIYLDEMLTRNLIKLDNIETEGKENIRLARKEAIRCIQKCIAVLEAKADNKTISVPETQNTDVNNVPEKEEEHEQQQETKEDCKEDIQDISKEVNVESKQDKFAEEVKEQTSEEIKSADVNAKNENQQEVPQPQAADTRPEDKSNEVEIKEVTTNSENVEINNKSEDTENKITPKKATKTKKRDKSKDKKEKDETVVEKNDSEAMQVDTKGDKESQAMEVDGAAASQ